MYIYMCIYKALCGPLTGHPVVANFFRAPYAMWPPPTLCSSADVLQLLLRFVTDRADQSRTASLQFPGNALRIDFDAFEAFAAQQLVCALDLSLADPRGADGAVAFEDMVVLDAEALSEGRSRLVQGATEMVRDLTFDLQRLVAVLSSEIAPPGRSARPHAGGMDLLGHAA